MSLAVQELGRTPGTDDGVIRNTGDMNRGAASFQGWICTRKHTLGRFEVAL